jgi:hypothetical protein
MVLDKKNKRAGRSLLTQSCLLFLAMGLSLAGAGCGSSSKNGNSGEQQPPPPEIVVSISPATAMVTAGQTQQFLASVLNTTNTAVNWTVTGPSGDLGSISDTGLYTAPISVPSGPITITATSVADSTKFATATVTVVASQSQISVSISPTTATVTISQTQQFVASVLNTSNTAVTWKVTGPAGDIGSISDTGLYTAPSIVPSGSVTVTATSVADATKFATATVQVQGYTGMLRYHNDLGNTGQNLNETKLTVSNVNATQFGKLFSYPLDGQSYAQPLYVSDVPVPNKGKHNLLFVATEHDTVYAFDADTQATLWSVNFTNPGAGVTTVPGDELGGGTNPIKPEVGITGTPVIDGNSGTLYVVAMTKENGAYIHRLHALDITSGQEKFGGPVVLQGSVQGKNGQVTFDSKQHLQRPGLLLSGGVVYICFGSYGDFNPYHGWIMGYDVHTLKQVAIFTSTPNGGDSAQGSFWQSGASLSADSDGNIYGIAANGTFDANNGGSDYGESFLKLQPGTLSVIDYFTPFNFQELNDGDIDIGSGGFTLLPDQPGPVPHLGLSAGKEGRIYLLNRDNLGKFQSGSDSQIVQSIPEAIGDFNFPNGHNFSTATYWQGNVYFIGNKDVIKQFALNNGLLSSQPVSSGTHIYGFPGGNMSISANGSQNGIVWAIEAGGANVLHAYDGTDVSRELYNTAQAGSRDQFGTAVRFTVPTVMNGKVFVAGQTELAVFGLF